jgi:soluble lytic murein transglycosylase-like protein
VSFPTPIQATPFVALEVTHPFHEGVELTMEEKIILRAEEYGVSTTTALAVAKCESGLDQGAKNPNSSASGIFQFLKSTWKSTLERMGLPSNLDVFDGDANIRAAMWLMAEDGIYTHWYPSYYCWKNG